MNETTIISVGLTISVISMIAALFGVALLPKNRRVDRAGAWMGLFFAFVVFTIFITKGMLMAPVTA